MDHHHPTTKLSALLPVLSDATRTLSRSLARSPSLSLSLSRPLDAPTSVRLAPAIVRFSRLRGFAERVDFFPPSRCATPDGNAYGPRRSAKTLESWMPPLYSLRLYCSPERIPSERPRTRDRCQRRGGGTQIQISLSARPAGLFTHFKIGQPCLPTAMLSKDVVGGATSLVGGTITLRFPPL